MFDIVSSIHKICVDPLADAALNSYDWKGWRPTHVARLSSEIEGMIAPLSDRGYFWPIYRKHFFFDAKWKKDSNSSFVIDLDYDEGKLMVVPLACVGWAIVAKSAEIRGPRRRLYHVLVIADGSEAVICASSPNIAKKLAVAAYQRARTGNCNSPLPGICWRPLPVTYWEWLFDDPMISLKPLESSFFDFGINMHYQCSYQPEPDQFLVRINFGDESLRRTFTRN